MPLWSHPRIALFYLKRVSRFFRPKKNEANNDKIDKSLFSQTQQDLKSYVVGRGSLNIPGDFGSVSNLQVKVLGANYQSFNSLILKKNYVSILLAIIVKKKWSFQNPFEMNIL